MAQSVDVGSARHDDLLRAAQAAGHVFAPVEEGQETNMAGASRRFLALSAISLSGFAASYGAFLVLG